MVVRSDSCRLEWIASCLCMLRKRRRYCYGCHAFSTLYVFYILKLTKIRIYDFYNQKEKKKCKRLSFNQHILIGHRNSGNALNEEIRPCPALQCMWAIQVFCTFKFLLCSVYHMPNKCPFTQCMVST